MEIEQPPLSDHRRGTSNVADDSRRQRNMHSAAAAPKKKRFVSMSRLYSLSCIQSPGARRLNSVADDNTNPSESAESTEVTPAAPEKKLTCLAVHLAIVEKLATRIGALAFIWATVVLLGGFASILEGKEFWSVTIIIFMQGARIFNRSHELKWQQHVSISRSIRHAESTTTVGQQAQCSPVGTHLCLQSSFFLPKLLGLLQFLSAVACAFLSVMGISWELFNVRSEEETGETKNWKEETAETNNQKPALLVFFVLALVEALIFLAEKSYWKYCCERLLKEVKMDCKLDDSEMVAIKRFLYDTYSRCLSGSIYDGSKMDLVFFSFELLQSDTHIEQLTAAQILCKFVTNARFADDTLRKIGTSNVVIERLIEMLNWKNTTKEEIRKSAAEILSKLAGKKHNALRVAGIPGAMESISSLLYTTEVNNLTLLGLLILKKLARDHDNCEKIGNTRGLLPKIIDFTSEVTPPQMKQVKRSLKLIKTLVSATGRTGKMLRKEISEIVLTISNIRQILQFGENHMELQDLGIQVLTNLATDEQARERIGGTGGIITKLLDIFLKPGSSDAQNFLNVEAREALAKLQNSVRVEAGRALAMLALGNERSCDGILKEKDVVDRLVEALKDSLVQVYSSRLLQHLCVYTRTKSPCCLNGVNAAIPIVLETIVTASTREEMKYPVVPEEFMKDMKLLEESIGLAVQLFRFNLEEYSEKLEEVAKKLVQILRFFDYPSIKVPKIRRYGIELAVWLMKSNGEYIRLFVKVELEKVLERIAKTSSEVECYNSFSGSLGLYQYKTTVCSLADSALKLMAKANI